MARTYVPLAVLSNYSFLEGASCPEELVVQAAAFDLPAVAITDRDGVYGLVRAHITAREAGIKLLAGSTLTRSDGPPLVALARNRRGYASLCRLISRGRAAVAKGSACLPTRTILEADCRDLLIIHPFLPEEPSAGALKEVFSDRLYAGIARYMLPGDEARLETVAARAGQHGIPLVAAPFVQFHQRNRKDLSDILAAIRLGVTVDKLGRDDGVPNANFTLLHPSVFRRIYQDHAAAADRTLEVADRCSFSLDELRYQYPREVVRPGMSPIESLKSLVREHLPIRWPGRVPPDVTRQIDVELGLIDELGYANYFLTMFDIVSFGRNQGILCQGRGSAANSAVCYALGITAVDPVRGNLLFERFISRERNEPPDIDVDFEHERREEVIQYIYRRYGRDRASMVAEFIRYRTRSAIRDVGKALGFSLPQVTRLSNLASSYRRDREDWWEQAVNAAGLSPAHPRIKAYHSLVTRLYGFPRHLSIHVGGFILSDLPVDHLVPVEPARMEGRTVIQWDKEDVEDAGLLKIDVLSLGMLTCIRRTFDLLRPRGTSLELASIPAEDPATYRMIRKADTVGVFQIESRAQMSMLPRLRPETFYDLVVEVAIVRPGPIQGGMVHPYLRRRQGLEPVDYPLPELEPVLGRTFGVPLFQEQVMKLAMVAAGFTGGEADQLRRAMGTWRSSGRMEGLLAKLMQRMEERGISPDYAQRIADQIKGFGEYGFPESHAASFALLAYASAYLKCHHPEAFAAALINSQPMGFYSPASIIEDCRRHRLDVRSICANASEWECTLEEERTPALRLGLLLVRNLPRQAADDLLAARRDGGTFSDLHDLVRRTRLTTHVLLKLALAGAFACFGYERREALWAVLSECNDSSSLFFGQKRGEAADIEPLAPWETVMADLDATQVYLSLHPYELVWPRVRGRKGYVTSSQLAALPDGKRIVTGGLAVIRQRPPTAGGVLFLTLEDHEGFINLVVPAPVFQRYRQVLLEEAILLVEGRVVQGDGVTNVSAFGLSGIRVTKEKERIRSRDFR
jgi:error-prone DNA polymerase